MLEGLEICEIKFSIVLKDIDLRLESEFYNFKNVIFECVKGTDIESFSQYGTSKDLNEEKRGFPVLRLNEFNSFFISKPSKYCDLISKETFELLKLKKEDVLICRTNGNPKYVGKAALVPKDYDYAFASYVYRLRPDKEIINSATLVAFMNSKYGRIEIEKFSMVGNQANFSPAKFRQISIPKFRKDFNILIEEIVYKSFNLLEQSSSLYSRAESLLYSNLGFKGWNPLNTSYTTKKYSDFVRSGRLDAEYYQSKYDELFERLSKVECKIIKEIKVINYRGFQPEYIDDGKIDVINSKHILEDGLDYDNFEKTDDISYGKAERSHVKYGDILTYTTGANIGRTQVYLSDRKAMASNHVNMLRVKDVNPIYLALALNSMIGRMQTERACTGSAQVEIYPNDIEKFVVPILDEPIQEAIASKVQESFAMKTESKRLLNVAKEAVEIAISNSEEKALQFIKEINL